jgi:hypothetical protein
VAGRLHVHLACSRGKSPKAQSLYQVVHMEEQKRKQMRIGLVELD